MRFIWTFVTIALLSFSFAQRAEAACGAINRTWDGDTNFWSQTTSWTGNNVPNTNNENAIVPSAGVGYLWVYNGNQTASCVDVTSGLLAFWTFNLTVTGDYFRALTPTSVYVGQPTSRLTMAGTAAQTLEMVDILPNLTISNNTSVTFTNAFKSSNAPLMSGTTTTLYIDDNFEVINNSAWTIPSGVSVIVRNGARVTLGGNLTVNGTFTLEAGGSLEVANGRTISVPSGGLFKIEGTSGNAGSVSTPSGGTFTFTVGGSINAEFFTMNRLSAAGLNVSGSIQRLENGEFHNIAAGGYGVTLSASTSIPSTMDGLGFFNEGGAATGNINASAYTGSASDATINNWLGDLGGETNDLDNNGSCGGDPPGCIAWGTEANTQLTVTDSTASGFPPATITAGGADTLFGTFAFALTKVDTASDITSITFTHVGTAGISEVDDIRIYADTSANCAYNAGVDLQIGADLNLSGSPATVTVTIPPATLTVNSTTPACIHLVSAASTTASRDNNIGFQIANTSHVTNSQGYNFSTSSGPPITTGVATITGPFNSQWTGSVSTNSTTNNNWFLNDPPSTTEPCQIGEGERICQFNAALNCSTAELPSNGTIDFNGFDFNVYGNLTVESGYTFTNAAGRNINMLGSVNQGIEVAQAFPGNLVINNGGGAGDDQIIATNSSEIQGNVTVTNGTLVIGNGVTFTIGGNLTIQNGAEVRVDPGGQLIMSNGSVVTVDLGGTLTVVGNASQTSTITSINTSSSYTIVVNGNIAARYYTISRLGGNGLTINAGATIDATNHLQNGSFNYPVTASTTFLRLFRAVPTNTMDNMIFETAGSAAATPTNIYTDASIGAGTLTITTYSGDLGGPTFDNDNTYLISWVGATNTIDIAQNATTPATMAAGDTVNMGRWRFNQALAGASFSNADITSFQVTMTGTGNTGDVDFIKLYYDSDCDGASGSLLGSQAPSGNPGTATFSIGAGLATVEADVTTPPNRCLYVEYDLAGSASDGKTLGAQLDSSGDFVNDQSYAPSGSVTFPVTLGTPGTITGSTLTIWTGTTNTDWYTASNWTAGVPTASLSCEIPDAANDPVITGGTAICQNLEITNGTVTMTNASGATLEVYGNFENTGTFTQNDGTLVMRDDGATLSNQKLESSTALTSVTFNKTAGGEIQLNGTTSINTVNFPAAQNFSFVVQSTASLTTTSSIAIPSGITFEMEGSSTLTLGAGTSLTVGGGTFTTTGVNDAYPQSTANKATITSAGTWTFNATSGSVALQGFIINNIDVNGLQINGTANLTQLDGGQFTNLQANYVTPVRAITLNTSTSITETSASNVGFNWGAANNTYNGDPVPADNYFLVYAPACGSQSLSFSQWFGDFWGTTPNPNTQDKIFDSADGANTCTVTIDASASPVAITSLNATPYNGVVDVAWTTGSELDHRGFNVYRSESPNHGFLQINSQLIKNLTASSTGQGQYTFRDQTVVNGKTYYYYVEDVAINGTTTMHGPVSAKPLSTLAGAPALNGNDGSDDVDTAPTDGSTANGEVVEIAPDVHILSSSASTFRIEIIPSAIQSQVSAWDGSYNTVSIPHFSRITQAGHPEILERTILVPIDGAYTGVSSDQVTLDQAAPVSLKIAPAADWVLNTGTGNLDPQWSLDNAIYTNNAYVFNNFYEVESATREIQGKHYIAIKVWPVKYNPVTEDYIKANKIVLDVYTGSSAWQDPGNTLTQLDPPASADNVTVLKINKSGMYEISYSDFVNFNAEGPFNGVDINEIRGYINNDEIPIEVLSGDGVFNTGDKIRFFGLHTVSIEDAYSNVILSPRNLYGTASALRIGNASSPYDGNYSTQDISTEKREDEQNNNARFDQPLGGHVDHYFWKRLVVNQATAGGAATYLDHSIDFSGLEQASSQNLNINFHLRGRGTDFNVSPTFKLALYFNGNSTAYATKEFTGLNSQIVRFEIKASDVLAGNNSLRIEALADNLTGANEAIFIDIDKISYDFPRKIYIDNAQIEILRDGFDNNIQIVDASTEPLVYDVSYHTQTQKISNYQWTPAGAEVSQYLFRAPSSVITDSFGAPLGIGGFRFIALEATQFLNVSNIEVSNGYASPLSLTTQQADYIIIGHEEHIAAAQELIQHRQNQGLSVRTAPLQQIYNEFSSGRQSTQAIQDFLKLAYSHWQEPKPKYVLIVGDSTQDPLNHDGNTLNNRVMSARLVQGAHVDFPSDVWYVSEEVQEGLWIPNMSVGRIPSSDTAEIQNYITKLISYENGSGLSDTGKNTIVFASDKSNNSEGFTSLSDNLKLTAVSGFSAFESQNIDRSQLTDADTKTALNEAFNTTQPLLITLNGHGAEDMWAGYSVFTNTEVDALSNTSYPMAVALNCLNGFSQFADPQERGLGEKMTLKKDGGSIAFWGSTALTSPRAQEALATGFYSYLSQKISMSDSNLRVGDAILQAQAQLTRTTGFQDVLMSWSFIGDPAMKLPEKVYPPVSNAEAPVAAPSQSGGGGGCSAFASAGRPHGGTAWDLAFGFLLEILMGLILIRTTARLCLARNKK